ncbi:hypothetical protein BN1723_020470 [Verticillium longisporum]|uniref:Uncharacterized protein n=1 Tax=Verticillium longisporum TaxID=100787 RepID=A0A0G4NNJ2_VERLO|nr:hypothetical protein BN1723_020470 [Verticillium longisporum]
MTRSCPTATVFSS